MQLVAEHRFVKVLLRILFDTIDGYYSLIVSRLVKQPGLTDILLMFTENGIWYGLPMHNLHANNI